MLFHQKMINKTLCMCVVYTMWVTRHFFSPPLQI